MANEIQKPHLTEPDLPPEEPLPAGAFPAPMVSESFNPYKKKGDLWLYKESFVDGFPDHWALLGILQRELHQQRVAEGNAAEDHAARLDDINQSTKGYGADPDSYRKP